ncbi:hypothetical protein JTE90_003953 [Oedothorax gibbosus]|uniref:Uncharacterized protein n=1 Tax=Oedothorax gibbosus TaxID=931172 RepID=A0AAV6UWE0_9ARAC|nr:hypothetical protein JTE90_003953 [Oedothorax gibbosus]
MFFFRLLSGRCPMCRSRDPRGCSDALTAAQDALPPRPVNLVSKGHAQIRPLVTHVLSYASPPSELMDKPVA